ncbi:MAG: hypothetical protein PHR14_10930, partial [Oscillospiraceae bacterium]|nr:hypothetical protein [Oscillospiraceae bacterium]
ELSARAIMRYAIEVSGGVYKYNLTEDATNRCISFSAPTVQDDCALYYQIMCVLHGDDFKMPVGAEVIPDLSDILITVDFSGIFDRNATTKKYIDRQIQAESMFRPDGITLDFGKGAYQYLAFERSASMSRNSRLSFIRADFYEPVRKRIMLDMQIGMCQLSKLYAYNGLMLTRGFRISDMTIWDEKRIVVVDNPVTPVYEANIITAEDDGSESAMRKYHRVEKKADIEVTEFDGEGLVSRKFAEKMDMEFCGKHIHSSFQIRMPYIKGVVHEVDFKSLFAELSVPYIVDIWGEKHPVQDVELILTKSMFKAFGWMMENDITWAEYLERCKKYCHALYISGVNQTEPQQYTELNYQFLNTVSMTAEEFRPLDLRLGWEHSPEEDNRNWITKETETEYYKLAADPASRKEYFTNVLNRSEADKRSVLLAKILEKNPLFINEPIYTKELENKAQSLLKQYAIGRLVTSGDNRYLSGDLMRFVLMLVKSVADVDDKYMGVVARLGGECYSETVAYAPGAAYPPKASYTLLRNPHIARNEEAVVSPPEYIGPLRQKYLSHLSYVIMVDSRTLIPERLGGADFDGDMIKTIADPLLNDCVTRNYKENDYDAYSHQSSIPLLKIPSATSLVLDANDWQARFEVVKSTFSTRIGQICNAAFDRSIIAYDENSDIEERERLQREVEMLEILTGLEIDSVKSGIKPDLTDFLSKKTVNRCLFLKYKNIVGEGESREWYEPTKKEKLKRFFSSVDWDSVTSNVERLPYLAKMLEEHTPKIKAKPAEDSELFIFAQDAGWKEALNPVDMDYMKTLIADYEEALNRIRRSWHIGDIKMIRRNDIERILYARGQENEFTADELYSIFNTFNAKRIKDLRESLTEEQWHLMPPEERERFLGLFLPYGTPQQYHTLFSDFRHGGYRIFGDIICDLDDAFAAGESKKQRLHRKGDSAVLKHLISGYEHMRSVDYTVAVANKCRQYINLKINVDSALKFAVAMGKRKFAFEVLLDRIEPNAVKGRD